MVKRQGVLSSLRRTFGGSKKINFKKRYDEYRKLSRNEVYIGEIVRRSFGGTAKALDISTDELMTKIKVRQDISMKQLGIIATKVASHGVIDMLYRTDTSHIVFVKGRLTHDDLKNDLIPSYQSIDMESECGYTIEEKERDLLDAIKLYKKKIYRGQHTINEGVFTEALKDIFNVLKEKSVIEDLYTAKTVTTVHSIEKSITSGDNIHEREQKQKQKQKKTQHVTYKISIDLIGHRDITMKLLSDMKGLKLAMNNQLATTFDGITLKRWKLVIIHDDKRGNFIRMHIQLNHVKNIK